MPLKGPAINNVTLPGPKTPQIGFVPSKTLPGTPYIVSPLTKKK